MKICKRCKIEKEITEFYKYPRMRDGYSSWCKSCTSEYGKEWNRKNPERHAERTRRYKENNRARINENRNRRRKENPEKTREENQKYESRRKGKRTAQKADWYFKNADEIKKKKRAQYAENPDKDISRALKWARENKDASRARCRKRRQIRLSAPGNGVTALEWNEILNRYGNKCLACGSTERIEMDHIVPLSEGGAHDPLNVQPLCKTCNCKKHASTIDYRKVINA